MRLVYTQEDRVRITAEMTHQNYSAAEIARRLGVTKRTVHRYRRARRQAESE